MSPARHRSLPLLALIGCALMLRALVPAGWMPAHTADGFALELCSGRTPGGDPVQLSAASALLDKALAGTSHPSKSDGGPSDQPCTFASLGLAWTVPDLKVPVLPEPEPASLATPTLIAAVGRGLPAPPPPATGPPLHA